VIVEQIKTIRVGPTSVKITHISKDHVSADNLDSGRFQFQKPGSLGHQHSCRHHKSARIKRDNNMYIIITAVTYINSGIGINQPGNNHVAQDADTRHV